MDKADYYFSFFPQFCREPINDAAWGKGFTDWDLIRRLPEETRESFTPFIGYYDPSDAGYIEVLTNQIRALPIRRAGLMIYHYFFDGVHALQGFETNLFKTLDAPPFFLCWANESWTKRWVGRPLDIIIEQSHRPDRAVIQAHAAYLTKFFQHPQYRRHQDRPLFVIYNPSAGPNLHASLGLYREYFRSLGVDPLIGYCMSYPREPVAGFDFVCEFEPRYFFNSHPGTPFPRWVSRLKDRFPAQFELFGGLRDRWRKRVGSHLFSYRKYLKMLESGALEESLRFSIGNLPLMRSVFLSWDNTPRYQGKATKVLHDEVEEGDFQRLGTITSDSGLPIVINSWNEWSEGAALEPGLKESHLKKALLALLGGKQSEPAGSEWPD